MNNNISYQFEPVVAYTDWRKLRYITDRVGMTFVLDKNDRWQFGGMSDYHQITVLLEHRTGVAKPKTKLSRKTLTRLPQQTFEELVRSFEEQIERDGVPWPK